MNNLEKENQELKRLFKLYINTVGEAEGVVYIDQIENKEDMEKIMEIDKG